MPTTRRHHRWRRALTAAAALTLTTGALAVGTGIGSADDAEAQAAPSVDGDSAMLNMFEWNWNSIAAECTDFLGDSGYTHIQVSPPQEHILATDTDSPDNWWIHYQPVSYELDSRLGTRAEFENMVSTCADQGVGVIADAVVNHMAAGATETRTGYAGSQYSQFDYPEAGYGPEDFHRTGDDYCEIEDYTDRDEIQNCHLVGLNDLATETENVRATVAAYLQDMVDIGVVGFRVDASKHMPAEDLEDILGRVSGDPYVVHEVIYNLDGDEPIEPDEYFGSGAVHQFDYSRWMRNHFDGEDKASYLVDLGEDWGLSPDQYAGVFVQNHDTPRGDDSENYLDYFTGGSAYELANVFMMAHDYGVPAQMSDYAYDDTDQGPPLTGDADSAVADVDCDADDTGPWACQHREPAFAGMAGFRAAVAGTEVTDPWHNDEDAFGFGRGESGYVVINAEDSDVEASVASSMPEGQYCDVLGGGTVSVDADGSFTASVEAGTALAIHVDAAGSDC